VMKIWGGSGKRTIKSKGAKREHKIPSNYEEQGAAPKREEPEAQEKAVQVVREKPAAEAKEKITQKAAEKAAPEKEPNKVLDFEELSKMYNEYKAAQYQQLAAAGNETAQTIYAKKHQNLKFLTL